MADIKIKVGIDTSTSYTEIRKGLNQIKDRLNENPIKIKVSLHKTESTDNLRRGIRDVIKGLNATPPKLKVDFDKRSVNAMKNKFKSLSKETSKASGRNGYDPTTKLLEGTKQYIAALEKVEKLKSKVSFDRERWSSAKRGDSKNSYKDLAVQIEALSALSDSLKSGNLTGEEFAKRFGSIKDKITADSNAIKLAGENTQSFFDKMGSVTKRFASWFTVSQVFMQLSIYARQMVDEAIKVESAMAQIQIVTGASDKQMSAFLQSSISLAKELGQSVTDVASSIETFARLGYNISDSSSLAKYANIMANVANTDIQTSTTGITSIIKGYQMDVTDAEHVADVLTKVGQEYAISAEELMAAFQRGGAALYASGTDFEKSAALFAATNASLQNAETTGKYNCPAS